MAIEFHDIPEKQIAETAVAALSDQSKLTNLVTKRTDLSSVYKREGDIISQRVPGVLPVRRYELWNDRSKPIVTDVYSETVVSARIEADRIYQATRLTDEQKDFQLEGTWGPIIDAQAQGLGDKLDNTVLRHILDAPYEARVIIDDTPTGIQEAAALGQDSLFNGLLNAQRTVKRLRTPDTNFTVLCGYNFADTLRRSQRLSAVQGQGLSALASTTIGSYANMTFVEDPNIDDDEALLFATSGFLFWTQAHSIPSSVPFGATASANGFSVRWMMDYEAGYLADRSVMDVVTASAYTRDKLTLEDQNGVLHVADGDYFLRGIKVALKSGGKAGFLPGDGTQSTPGSAADSTLAKVFRKEKITTVIENGTPFPLAGHPVTMDTAYGTATTEPTV